jgi:hypothetical protein
MRKSFRINILAGDVLEVGARVDPARVFGKHHPPKPNP